MPNYSVQHTWHPDVTNLSRRITSAGGALPAASAKAISEFAHTCQINGLRDSTNPANSLIRHVWIPATSAFAGSLECLWYPSSVSSALTNVGFVSGDYSLTTGFTGGTSKYLRTGFVPNAHLSGWDIHFGFYNRTAGAGISEAFGMVGTSGDLAVLRIFPRFTNGQTIFQFAGGIEQAGTADPLGLLMFSQTPDNYAGWLKTTKILSTSLNPTSGVNNLNRDIWLFTFPDVNGNPTAFSAKSCGGSTIGRGLSDTQAPIYATAWQTLQTALGRAV